jgi:hypothetical protein
MSASGDLAQTAESSTSSRGQLRLVSMRFTFDPEVDMALLHLGAQGEGQILTCFARLGTEG